MLLSNSLSNYYESGGWYLTPQEPSVTCPQEIQDICPLLITTPELRQTPIEQASLATKTLGNKNLDVNMLYRSRQSAVVIDVVG